ncbi:MAG TPA: hypothetical protein VFH31_10225 [Pyrinomonadaceae bacterium]|nr:hypothetical protein [Pyrinomonadaceae bacterium]
MSLTRSLCCHRLSFTDTAFCPSCGKTFQPGVLQAQAVAEEKAFSMKAYAIFLGAFLTLLWMLIFVLFQVYPNGVGN